MKDGDENFVNDFVFSVDDIAEGECVGFAVWGGSDGANGWVVHFIGR